MLNPLNPAIPPHRRVELLPRPRLSRIIYVMENDHGRDYICDKFGIGQKMWKIIRDNKDSIINNNYKYIKK